MFSYVNEGNKLKIIKYNKDLQKIANINKYQKMIKNAKEKIQQMQEEEKKQESEFDR